VDILVIEDEPRVANFLKRSLEAESHCVQLCKDAQELEAALHLPRASRDTPEVVILDRMLRGSEGLDYISEIRRSFPTCRILVLSAIDMPEEKAKALDLGADDYLAKPFSLTELSARLRVLARRAVEPSKALILQTKDLSIDLSLQTVCVRGRKIDLSKKEYQILVVLSQHPGRVFNKYQLLDKVWDMQFTVESNTVEVTIRNLRKKLEQGGVSLEILSKRNIGYWIES
jgi:DNA-binding response OmpR family regulator